MSGYFRKKKINFTMVSNSALDDDTLSLKAQGLYAKIQRYITIEGFKLYKNTDLNNNILSNAELKQDVDGSYYRVYTVNDEVLMEYKDKIIDVYTLSIDFPKKYAEDLTYADCLEAIEVIIDSSQAV